MTLDALILEEITKLQRRSKELDAEIKAKTIRIASLDDEAITAQMACAEKIRDAEAKQTTRIAELEAQREPLERQIAKLQEMASTQQTTQTQSAQRFHEESSQRKLEKLNTLNALEAQIAAASTKLTQIQQDIETCKQKVATL